MLLGKRPRPSMKRTTSLKELTGDPIDLGGPAKATNTATADPQDVVRDWGGVVRRNGVNDDGFDGNRFITAVGVSSPRNQRRNAGDSFETAQFLRACELCHRRLGPGRDIYMYRGDTAFCSLECRQQRMNQDERKEKCSMASKKEASSNTNRSKSSNKGETVAAA